MRSILAAGRARLRDGRAAGDARRHERHPRHGHAGVAHRRCSARRKRNSSSAAGSTRGPSSSTSGSSPPPTRPASTSSSSRSFLRKKYTDPMTKSGEFEILYQGTLAQRQAALAAGRGGDVPGRAGGRRPQRAPGPPVDGAGFAVRHRRWPGRRAAWSASPARARRSRSGSSTAARLQRMAVRLRSCAGDPHAVPRARPGRAAAAVSPERRSRGPQRGRGPGGRRQPVLAGRPNPASAASSRRRSPAARRGRPAGWPASARSARRPGGPGWSAAPRRHPAQGRSRATSP